MQVAPYIQLNKSIRCDRMLLCLDNAISAGDEAEEVSTPEEVLGGGEGGDLALTQVSSSKSNNTDSGPFPPGTSSPIGSKHRTGRTSSGSRPRHITETVVSSSDMDASDKWELEPGLSKTVPAVKEKKVKDKKSRDVEKS